MNTTSTAKGNAPAKRSRGGRAKRTIKTASKSVSGRTGRDCGGSLNRPVGTDGGMRPRTVVVTEIDAIFVPLAVVTDVGLTVQLVARAGTVQESVTGGGNPKKRVIAMSFMYEPGCPAPTA